MADLSIPEVGGHGAPQAFTQTNPASSFGNDIAKPMAAPTIDPGAFQNTAGDVAMAKMVGDVTNMVGDTINREKALRIASEEEQRKLHTAEYNTAAIESKQAVKDAQMRGYLDPDSMNNLYQYTLNKKLDAIDAKYNYQTSVGNALPKLRQIFVDGKNASYNGKEVEDARVDGLKTTAIQSVQTVSSQTTASIQDGTFTPELGKQNRDKIVELTSSPQWVIANGGSAAAYAAQQKLLKDYDTDTVGGLIAVDPKMAEQLLEEQGPNDQMSYLDPSTRTILHQTAHREAAAQAAEKKAALSEASNKTMANLVQDIHDGKVSIAQLTKLYNSNQIDVMDYTTGQKQVLAEQDRRQKDAEARAEKAQRHTDSMRVQQAIDNQTYQARLNSGVGYSPADPAEIKSVNKIWALDANKRAAMTPAQRMDYTENFLNTHHVAPTELKKSLELGMNSSDSATVSSAIATYKRLSVKSPWVLSFMKGDQKATWEMVGNQGKSLAEAQKIIANKHTVSDTVQAIYNVNRQKFLTDNPNALAKALGFTPPPSALGVYYDSFKNNMLLTGGDEKAASNIAIQDVKNLNYAVSAAGRGVPAAAVRNAPEAATRSRTEDFNSSAENYMRYKGAKVPAVWSPVDAGIDKKTGMQQWVYVDANHLPIKDGNGNPLAPQIYSPKSTDAYDKSIKQQAVELKKARTEQEIADLRALQNKSVYTTLNADDQAQLDALKKKHPNPVMESVKNTKIPFTDKTVGDLRQVGDAGATAVEAGLSTVEKAAKDWKKRQSGFPDKNKVNTVTPGTFKEQK